MMGKPTGCRKTGRVDRERVKDAELPEGDRSHGGRDFEDPPLRLMVFGERLNSLTSNETINSKTLLFLFPLSIPPVVLALPCFTCASLH